MTIGIGGSSVAEELNTFKNMASQAKPIEIEEFQQRIEQAKVLMRATNLDAIYINAGTSLLYFTGTPWSASERMVGAVITVAGHLEYIAPVFEQATLVDFMQVQAKVNGWQEHESPFVLLGKVLARLGVSSGTVAVDPSTAFFIVAGLQQACPEYQFVNDTRVTPVCRQTKSENELALLQLAKNITLRVHQSAARILRPDISTLEVVDFINEAHKAAGVTTGTTFCLVQFGEASAYPHGVKEPQFLQQGDIVLIDTGCRVQGYHSDITRTYVFGEPNAKQRQVWNAEKAAQAAAFEAATIGASCEAVDAAARKVLEHAGFGPDYALPGLPHRTGHGIGLDIHEGPYLVRGDKTRLAAGMCFSNEPMICIPGEFGIRHEDHFYITEHGAKWFTEPAHSVDDPFAYEVTSNDKPNTSPLTNE